jgi:CRP-like cAMP-binding protein
MVVSAPELKTFLLATPFFGGLPDPSLDLLISMLVECRFDAGATVVAESEPGRSLFIVKSGRLAVSKRANSGNVIPISVLEAGDFFGEMTLIEMQNRSATVVAESPTVLYELTAQKLYACYKADIHAYVIVLQNVNRELCRRLRRADDRLTGHQADEDETPARCLCYSAPPQVRSAADGPGLRSRSIRATPLRVGRSAHRSRDPIVP